MIVIKHNGLALAMEDLVFTNNCWLYEDKVVDRRLVELALEVYDCLDGIPSIAHFVFSNIIHIYLSKEQVGLKIVIQCGDKKIDHIAGPYTQIKQLLIELLFEGGTKPAYKKKWESIAYWVGYDTSRDQHETRGQAEAVARLLLVEGNSLGKPKMTAIRRLT